MSTQLWSGRTCYVKYQDSKGRDVFAPQGYPLTVDDGSSNSKVPSPYAWRVKQDASTGKFFFVSLSTLTKRWRLPDLNDEAFQQELIQWSQTQKAAAVAITTTPSSGGGMIDNDLSMTPPHHLHNSSAYTSGKATPSGRHGSTAANHHDVSDGLYTTAVHNSPALFVASPSPTFFFAKTNNATVTTPLKQQQHDLITTPNSSSHPTQQKAFVYDDEEWKAVDAKHRRLAQLREQEDAMRMQQSIEADEMRKGVGPAGRSHQQHQQQQYHNSNNGNGGDSLSPSSYAQQFPQCNHNATSSGTPYDEFVPYGNDSHASAVNHEMNRRRVDREGRQRAIYGELAALEAEERLLELQTKREEDQLRKLEEQQLDAVRQSSSNHHLLQQQQHQQASSVPVGAAPIHNAAHYQNHSLQPGGVLLVDHPLRSPPQHYHQTMVPDPYHRGGPGTTGAPPTTAAAVDTQHLTSVIQTLQKMLDHEREVNAKLQQQLEEKEQLALEQLAIDAEREQREIAMRIRMLEAIAAHRREVELLAEEKKQQEQYAQDGGGGGGETLRAQLARHAQRYIPDHPLGSTEDEDFV